MRHWYVYVFGLSMLLPMPGVARTWHVPGDAATIQAGIDSAAVGDDVLVSAGVYSEADIAMKAGIWVHSEQGPDFTIIDAAGVAIALRCYNLEQVTTIEGFEIRKGHAYDTDGGGVRCVASSLVVRDCIITDCSADYDGGGIGAWASDLLVERCRVVRCSAGQNAGGIYAYDTSFTLTDCEVSQNLADDSDGGIFAYGPEVTIAGCLISENEARYGYGVVCTSAALTIRDCLVTHNLSHELAGGGLYVLQSVGTITDCTVADNVGAPDPFWGIAIDSQSSIQVERTIVAFHQGGGLGCSGGSSVHCCDLYGNTGGNDICGDDLGGNFFADPLFCDAGSGDYTLESNSPCLPGNHPDGVNCGLIGARGVGCGSIPVEMTTWGQIKAGFR